MVVRYFALLMGILFTVAGISGFLPVFTHPAHSGMPSLSLHASYGLLLGLFPVNLIHNIFHLGLGLWGLKAYSNALSAQLFSKVLAFTLTVFTIMGLLPTLNTVWGTLPLFGHDIWLHGLEAVAAFYFGFIYNLSPVQAVEVNDGLV